jgi:NADH-quinone oxidoreductase subunit N
MSAADFEVLLPLLVIAATAVVVLLVIAVSRRHDRTAAVTFLGLALAVASVPIASRAAPRAVSPLLAIDRYALFFLGLTLCASLVVTLLSYGYLKERRGNPEELYVALLIATLGSGVLVASRHFVSFFLGLEVLSISLYVMIGYPLTAERALEASLKYLVLAGTSSAFLLFGMAAIYARFGTMDFVGIGAAVAAGGDYQDVYLLSGLALILTGIGFKLGVVPFHLWAPDVYQGAPAPFAGFLASVSKGAMFALLLRFVAETGLSGSESLLRGLAAIAIASMLGGNLLALLQDSVKRVLAYSSIAHFGYLLVALLAGGLAGIEAASFYLVAYFVTILGAFGLIAVVSSTTGDADCIADYRGLFWRRPWLSGLFTAVLLSLAGIPMTAGFFAKFYVLSAGVRSEVWTLLVVLVVSSAIGLFYYLRIVLAMYGVAPHERPVETRTSPRVSVEARVALIGLGLLLLALGVYPAPLAHFIHATVSRTARR